MLRAFYELLIFWNIHLSFDDNATTCNIEDIFESIFFTCECHLSPKLIELLQLNLLTKFLSFSIFFLNVFGNLSNLRVAKLPELLGKSQKATSFARACGKVPRWLPSVFLDIGPQNFFVSCLVILICMNFRQFLRSSSRFFFGLWTLRLME